MQRPILKWNGFYLLFILGGCGGVSRSLTLSLHFTSLNPTQNVSARAIVFRRRWRLRVLTSPRPGSAQRGRGGGSTGEDRRRSNCLAWWSALQWTETAVSLEKPSPTASCRLFLAIFLATLCLLNMHFMLHLHFSSPSREPLALTLLASRAVQHCALYKSQQP